MVFSDFFQRSGGQKKRARASDHDRNPKEKRINYSSSSKSSCLAYAKPKNISGKRCLREDNKDERERPSKRQHPKSKPSVEALRLSERLKELSREKKLDEAMQVYLNTKNDSVRDGHHLCIIVDCCARCGRIEEGEKLANDIKKQGKSVNVETNTALIKGLAHSGRMSKAEGLFASMCAAPGKSERPNVRTMNTLLRGCLWSAASVDNDGNITGGVVTAERAWDLCCKLQERCTKLILFDVSSYEYSITLLCQGLRTDDARNRIKEMNTFFEISETSVDIPQSVSEAFALSHLALARAFAILGESESARSACDTFLQFANVSRKSLASGETIASRKGRYAIKQGKESKGSRRAESNSLYRNHRIDEAEREARVILELCDIKGLACAPRQLARRLVTRLLVLSGGGSTDAENDFLCGGSEVSRSAQTRFLNTLYSSYGLKQILEKLSVSTNQGSDFLRKRDCNRILGSIGLQGGIVGPDGCLDVQRIFRVGIGDNRKQKHSRRSNGLEIELGAGFGEWIVQKARQTQTTNFLSVELRADRVGQTFAKTAMLAGTMPVDNLCIVGADSRSFLSHQIKEHSVSAIYVNHPEPPTQTFGADDISLESIAKGGPEPAHMITSQMLMAAGRCLSMSGNARLIIVTDNRWHGRLICATVAKVMYLQKDLFVPIRLEDHSLKIVDSFSAESGGQVFLYEGQPNESIGHPKQEKSGSNGATYFDRLWRSGAGSHSEISSRFIVAVTRGCGG